MAALPIAWSQEELTSLRNLWSVRPALSGAKIAARLGTGRSRHSVIAMADSIGLPKRPRVALHNRPAFRVITNPNRPVEAKLGRPSTPHGRALIKAEIRREELQPPPQPRGNRPTFMELESHNCRWPFGDVGHAEFHFCGSTITREGSSYCEFHHAVAYLTAEQPARTA